MDYNLPTGPPPDSVLIRTGGNALQAVSRRALEQKGLMAVSVPEGLNPGDNLLVRSPDGSGRVISAVVPEGALPGHTFLVQMPVEEKPPTPIAVMGVPVQADLLDTYTSSQQQEQQSHGNAGAGTKVVVGQDIESTDLRLVEESSPPERVSSHPQPSSELELAPGRDTAQYRPTDNANTTRSTESTSSDSNLVLIKVPPGVAPGTKIRVKVPDGRTVDATVPVGNVQEFYLRLPPRRQNWHDNPLAVAPMVVAPLFF
jgi:hypothetical protein